MGQAEALTWLEALCFVLDSVVLLLEHFYYVVDDTATVSVCVCVCVCAVNHQILQRYCCCATKNFGLVMLSFAFLLGGC